MLELKILSKLTGLTAIFSISLSFMAISCSHKADSSSPKGTTDRSLDDSGKNTSPILFLAQYQKELDGYSEAYQRYVFQNKFSESNKQSIDSNNQVSAPDANVQKAAQLKIMIDQFRSISATVISYLKQIKSTSSPNDIAFVENIFKQSVPMIKSMVELALLILEQCPGLHGQGTAKIARVFFNNLPQLLQTTMEIFLEVYKTITPQEMEQLGKSLDSFLALIQNYSDLLVAHISVTDMLNSIVKVCFGPANAGN